MLGAVAKALAKQTIGKTLMNNKGKVINGATSLLFGGMTYQQEREEGSGVLASLGSAAVDTALPFLLGPWGYAAYIGVTEGPQAAAAATDAFDKYSRKLGKERAGQAFQNAQFNDTQQTYTMRQAGMAIAQRSKYNTQQAMLGNEAKYMMK